MWELTSGQISTRIGDILTESGDLTNKTSPKLKKDGVEQQTLDLIDITVVNFTVKVELCRVVKSKAAPTLRIHISFRYVSN